MNTALYAIGQESRKKVEKIIPYLPYIIMGLYLVFCVTSNLVFATQQDTQGAFNIIIGVGKYICGILGAIFLFVGIVRYVIAHNNDSGPDMQKAAQMLATGLVLIGISAALTVASFTTLVNPLNINGDTKG